MLHYDICKKLDIDPDLVLKKKIRGLNGITAAQLIEALIASSNIYDAATILGYTDNPVKQCIRQLLHPIFGVKNGKFASGCTGNITSWRTSLLATIEHRYCNTCKNIKPYTDFYKDISKHSDSTTGLMPRCKSCHIASVKTHKFYIVERTPSWADLDIIREFYSNCPKGYHVDHEIPLRGRLISGLHVIENLRYIKAEDNRVKSNKYTIE